MRITLGSKGVREGEIIMMKMKNRIEACSSHLFTGRERQIAMHVICAASGR